MNPAAQDWPPQVPGLSTLTEIAEARDLKWFLARYWKWIALCGALAATLGVGWVHFFPPQFVSQATVRFLPPQVAGRFVNPNFSMEVGQRLFALSQLLSSRLTAARLIESFALYPERRRFQTVEDLTAKFIEDLQVARTGSAGDDPKAVPTLRISFAYPDAEKAQRVVQKLVEQIYEENRKYRGDQSLGTTEFLTDQLSAAEERVLETEQRLGEIQDAIGLTVSQTRLGQNTSRSYVIDSRLRDIRHDRRQQEERRATKRAEWEQLELVHRRIETRPLEFYIPEFETMPSYWMLKEKVTSAKGRWERLKERYRDGFPDVSSAENDFRELEQTIERFQKERSARLKNRDLEANAGRIALAKLELQAIDKESGEQIREEGELRAEAQRLREQQGAPAGQEVEMLVAKREYESAKNHHEELVRKHEESRTASEMERRGQGESVEMLEPASLPTRTALPTWWMRIVLAGLMGLAAGMLACLVIVLREPKILHGGHLESWAGLEVLASFVMEDRIKKSKAGFRAKAATTVALLVMLLGTSCSEVFAAAAELCAKGEAAEREGKVSAAMLYYRRAIQKDAKYAPAYAAIARIDLQLGELPAAREALARAVELSPTEERLVKLLADTSYQIYFSDPGRPTVLLREVESLGDKLRGRWPAHPDGYRILAQVLMERHRTEEAILLLNDASSKVKNNESLRAQMAAAMFRVGKLEESRVVLENLIENSPAYLDAYDILYLQWMQRKQSSRAREVLVTKWEQTQEIESALQLAAHDDAHGQRDLARKSLDALLAKASRKVLGMARIGDFWLQRAEWKLARAAYERGQGIETGKRADYTGRIAEWHLAQGQKLAARTLVEAEFAKDPTSILLEAYLAAVRLGEVPVERRTEERKRLEAILQRMPDSPFVRYHLGRAYLLEKNWQPAAEQFERSVKLDANYAAGWLALAELELVRGNVAVAEQRAETVLQMNPRNSRAMMVRASAQARRGKTAEAKSSFEEVLKAEPDNNDARFWLAVAQAEQGRWGEAGKLFEEGRTKERENPRWVLAQVALLTRDGKEAEARQSLERELDRQGPKQELLARFAELQIQMKDGAGAGKTYERLITMAGNNLNYHLGRAGAAALAGDRETSLRYYSRLQLDHSSDLRVWLQPAALLGEMGRTAEARRAYEEVLKRDSENAFALNNLAWLLLRRGEEPRHALEYVQRAKRTVRQSPEVDGTLAEAYLKLDMNRNAVAVYQEMLSYLPEADKPRVEKLLEAARRRGRKEGNS